MAQGATRLQWRSAALTDQGKRRKHNEDALLSRPDLHLWAVADGMGGHAAGDVASKMIVEALESVTPAEDLANFFDSVTSCLHIASEQIASYARVEYDGRVMGATVVALFAGARYAGCVWAGDSRLYRFRNGQIEQLTRDHSEVQRMVEQGLLTPDEAEVHPSANIITRAVGGATELMLDTLVFEPQPGDRFLLCSDGLYNEVDKVGMLELMAGDDLQQVVAALIERTLAMGARDNVSVVVVEAQD